MDKTQAEQFLRKVIEEDVFVTHKDMPLSHPDGTPAQWVFDFKRVLLRPDVLEAVSTLFLSRCEQLLPAQIGGLESAALPLISSIVLDAKRRGFDVSGFYVRKSRKKYGSLALIEGTLVNEPIILVDDLINSGKSIMKEVEILESLGKKVSAIFVLLQYRDNSFYAYFHEKNIPIYSIFYLSHFEESLGVRREHLEPIKPTLFQFFENVWSVRVGKPVLSHVKEKSGIIIDENRLYTRTDNGEVCALNQDDGTLVWKQKVPLLTKNILTSLFLHNKNIYIGGSDGTLHAFDTTNGTRLWTNLEANILTSLYAIDPQHSCVYLGAQCGWWRKGNVVLGIDLVSGKTLFKIPFLEEFSIAFVSFLPGKDLIIVGFSNGTLYGVERKEKKIRWKFNAEGDLHGQGSFSEDGKCFLFGTHTEGILYCIDTETGELLYKTTLDSWCYANILTRNSTAYIVTLGKKIFAVDISSGKVIWEFEADGRIFAMPLFHEGVLYFGTTDARLYALDASSGKLLGMFQTTERIMNTPVLNKKTGDLFFTTYTHEIYCLRRKNQSRRD